MEEATEVDIARTVRLALMRILCFGYIDTSCRKEGMNNAL